MNDLRDLRDLRRRAIRGVLVVASLATLLLTAVAMSGCGSAKKAAVPEKRDLRIAFVKVLPGDRTLQKGVTVIWLRQNTAFVVGVGNFGSGPEKNVEVTLTIRQLSPSPVIKKTMLVPQIDTGTTKKVVFGGPFLIQTMIARIPIEVEVRPVEGETNVADNSATYEVRFSF